MQNCLLSVLLVKKCLCCLFTINVTCILLSNAVTFRHFLVSAEILWQQLLKIHCQMLQTSAISWAQNSCFDILWSHEWHSDVLKCCRCFLWSLLMWTWMFLSFGLVDVVISWSVLWQVCSSLIVSARVTCLISTALFFSALSYCGRRIFNLFLHSCSSNSRVWC